MLKTTFNEIINPLGRVILNKTDTDRINMIDLSLKNLDIYLVIITFCTLCAIRINNQILIDIFLCSGGALAVSILLLSFLTQFISLSLLPDYTICNYDKKTESILRHKEKEFKFYLNFYRKTLLSIIATFVLIKFEFIQLEIVILLTIIRILLAYISVTLMRNKLVDISSTEYNYYSKLA